MHDNLEQEIVSLSKEEALSRLEVIDYDPGDGTAECVHTLRGAYGMMIGAHWYLSEIDALIDKHGAEEAGPSAQAMHHGVVVIDDHGALFLGTKS